MTDHARLRTDLPRRMLTLICTTLNQDLNIEAEMSDFGNTPAIKMGLGNTIYFNSSDSFRIFLKKPGPLGVTFITVKGTPDDLLNKIVELNNGE